MRALCYHGKNDVRMETVPDPKILNPRDIILRVTSTAICGSDLHIYAGLIPGMESGDILGHEFMGEVVEVGTAIHHLKVGDRVVVPFTIACGNCFFCGSQQWSLCDNSNPNPHLPEKLYGYTASGLFGYSHIYGGYAGGQAEYVRVPYADVGPIKIPSSLPDEKVLYLSDIFPTGFQAAENCNIQEGDTVAIWGCGPVGQFAIRSALMLGAGRVIAIDSDPDRLKMARDGGAMTLNFNEVNVLKMLPELTGGRGPDSVIDAVGMEATGHGIGALYDRTWMALGIGTDRPNALRQAIMACRKGGTVSIPGVYGGLLDKLPIGAAFAKSLTFKMGQTHMMKYLRPLLERIENGEIDPSFIITHRGTLEDAPAYYKSFVERGSVIKTFLQPKALAKNTPSINEQLAGLPL